ncbi:aspartyl protease family protein [Altererythrobacter arenosus]|uniref:Aspartyl protease family protein n=1 Tax=Altererythrobacter arenosus TaxID=3032592 RepID=A0ABY8FT76_9SPHN|nr:aspartyl protease family protein [Altererythrobacter sp. CAU 1644]WFL77285.1 aspartyl protease family protein [Altererythrobacter sp. CAU 1644]
MNRIPILLCALGFLAPAMPAKADELIVRGDRLFIPVEVNGVVYEALLDSGAEVTILDPEVARQLALQPGKSAEARGTGASTVEAELIENLTLRTIGREVTVPVAAIIDLGDIGKRLIGRKLAMILGQEVFDAGRLLLNIEKSAIEYVGHDLEIQGVRLPLNSANGIETITVEVDGVEVQADFDLGNGTGMLISPELAQRLRLDPVGIEPGGGLGGSVGRPVVFVRELVVAGKTFENVRAHISANNDAEANVGVSILRNFQIVTDFKNKAVWLAQREH